MKKSKKGKSQEKLWSKDFFLVWQGQLVSTIGDSAYSVALGFWVLQTTGSTALMGTLMAVSALPGILISPFAGVWIDRMNKKALLITMDIIRGAGIVLLATAAFMNVIKVWMVFAAGILLSICGAVFRPCVNSSIPEMIPKSKLSNANSMLSAASTGSNMLGNVMGGYLFQIFGAPLLFLVNGVSYFFSGTSLGFVKLPKNQSNNKQNFIKDMKDGFRYMWNQKILRYLLIIAAIMNFFSFVAIVLFLPLFRNTPSLGAGKYGIAMACFMGGSMLGFVFSSVVTFPSHRRAFLLIIANGIMSISFALAVNQQLFCIMILFILMGGFFNAILNVILLSSVQSTTPNEMRGKVLAFMNMITQSLTPFAMAFGGILASFIPAKTIITLSFIIILLVISPFAFVKSFIRSLNFDE
ncbi:MAG: MFS transporter [Bacillota bacterium]|nr:MFS transporter [Bacillota bacterium]